jgi:glycosyltransferase involved in cell wall biosynthesis
MKVLILSNKDINLYPPVKTLVDILLDLNCEITLCTRDAYGYVDEVSCSRLKCVNIEEFKGENLVTRITWGAKFRKYVKEVADQYDLIWTTTDTTISLVGRQLLERKNHIMQLMELVEDVPKFPYKFIYDLHLEKVFKVNLSAYAKHAKCVVVPEINRAHIIKAMWNLDTLPSVLPNKPYSLNVENPSHDILDVVNKLKETGKKIILYQGIFRKERRLDEFAQAVRELGDEYAFCIMGTDSSERKELCEKNPDIVYIPFIKPPYHLMVTQLAYIGILTYYPSKDDFADKLNVLYCAPNKLYEYAYSGLPMIGNNIPGLSGPFEKYNIGKCFDELSSDSILSVLRDIEENYDSMKVSCKTFFDDVDMKSIVEKITGIKGEAE